MPKILKSEIASSRGKLTLGLVLLISLALSASAVYAEVFVQRMINGVTVPGSANVLHNFYIYLALGLILLAGRTVFSAFSYVVFLKMTHRVRKGYLNLISFGDEIRDSESFQTGDLNDRLTKDIDQCRLFCQQTLIPVWSDVIQVITIICVLFFQSVLIGAAFTGYLLLSILVLRHVNTSGNDVIPKLRRREAKTADFLQDVFVNNNDVAPMQASSRVIAWFNKQYDKLLPLELHAQSFIYRSWIAALVLIAFLEVTSLALGGYSFLRGVIGLGTVYMMIDYATRIQAPLESMQFHANNVQYLKGAFANLAELERKFVMQSGNSPYPTKPTIRLHISNLRNFDHQVLKKVDMAIAPGQIIGLSGVSGSGKSTLAKAIVGLQHQYEGQIDYSKTPISKISTSEMGANVAYVSVDQSLFHVSIEKSLQGFSVNNATQNVWQRLEQLGVSKARLDYLRTTLSAQVGEDGANIDKLADGDRQLLLILRALLQEKDLIILDETLSSLDTARFAEVSRLLRHYVDTFKIKMILISHKTNRLHFADHVYGITKGECVYFSKLADWASTYEDEQNVKNS